MNEDSIRKNYRIRDVDNNSNVIQGENNRIIEIANTSPEINDLKQQFDKVLEEISKDSNFDEDEKTISKQKVEQIAENLVKAKDSPEDLHRSLIDAKSWFSNKAGGIWTKLSNILKSDAAQTTIGTITESATRGAIKAFIG
jgi:hypothetical protein